MLVGAAGLILVSAMPGSAAGQVGVLPLSGRARLSASSEDSNDHNWKRFAFGFGASILAHEGAHVLSSVLMGYHPYYAFDHGRPTVYSGINSEAEPHKQFIFSASGLTTQAIINEAVSAILAFGSSPSCCSVPASPENSKASCRTCGGDTRKGPGPSRPTSRPIDRCARARRARGIV